MEKNNVKEFVNNLVEKAMLEKIKSVGVNISLLKELGLLEDFKMECYIIRKNILKLSKNDNLDLRDIQAMIDTSSIDFIKNYLIDSLMTTSIDSEEFTIVKRVSSMPCGVIINIL